MQTNRYWVFLPTTEFTELASAAGEQWLLVPEAYCEVVRDRGPRGRTLEEIEFAAWTVLLAKLAPGNEAEDAAHRDLRAFCQRVGWRGCFCTVACEGGDLEDLIAEAERVRHLTHW